MAADKRQVLFLPEASDYVARSGAEAVSLAKPVASSPFVTGLQAAAARHGLAVHVGIHVPVQSGPSPVRSEGVSKLYNRTIWIGHDGSIDPRASYDKLHLFDYGKLAESATTQAGENLTAPFPSPVGRIGSLICFDLHFPEPALRLARPGPGAAFAASPAQVLLYPSAFTVPTGRAHWEVLLRARAIETQSWVVAAAQVGRHGLGSQRVSYGTSMVVDPWGKVVPQLKLVEGDTDASSSSSSDAPSLPRDKRGRVAAYRYSSLPVSGHALMLDVRFDA